MSVFFSRFDGEVYNQSEEMSPSTERLAVFLWLYYIDERLPMYIVRVYSHELQKMTLKDLQPTLSQNMDSLLIELAAQEDIKLNYSNSSSRASYSNKRPFNKAQSKNISRRSGFGNAPKTCAFCKACKKPFTGHDVNNCWTLARFNKSDIMTALMVNVEEDDEIDEQMIDSFASLSTESRLAYVSPAESPLPLSTVSRVEVMKSPTFVCNYKGHQCTVTLDTGATSNFVSLNFVRATGVPLIRTNQGAKQLDRSQVNTF